MANETKRMQRNPLHIMMRFDSNVHRILFTFIIISISFLFYTLQFFVIFCFSIVQMSVRRSVAVFLLLVLRL